MLGVDPYREYQDYVMAHRLKEDLGQLPGKLHSLPQYAALRLRRSENVRQLVARQGDPALLAQIESLSDDLCYGFWSNPGTLKNFLKKLPSVAYPVLENPVDFERLLSSSEYRRMGEPGLAGRYYLGWLRLPHLVMEPLAFEQAMREQEAMGERMGLFLDVFNQVAG
jgi:hypothetical protein